MQVETIFETGPEAPFSLEEHNRQFERLLQKAALIAGALRAFRELAHEAAQPNPQTRN